VLAPMKDGKYSLKDEGLMQEEKKGKVRKTYMPTKYS